MNFSPGFILHDACGPILDESYSEKQKVEELGKLDRGFSGLSQNAGLYQVELLPGVDKSSKSNRWSGIVISCKPTAKLQLMWRDDMLGCEAVYMIPLLPSNRTGDQSLLIGDVLAPLIRTSVKVSIIDENIDGVPTTTQVLHGVGDVLAAFEKDETFRKFIQDARLDDVSADAKRAHDIQVGVQDIQPSTAELHTRAIADDLTELYVGDRAPFGDYNCSINLYLSADSDRPQAPALWLMVRNHDPVVNAMLHSWFKSSDVGTFVQSAAYKYAEKNAANLCDTIAFRVITELSKLFPRVVASIAPPNTKSAPLADDDTQQPPWLNSDEIEAVVPYRACIYHYNVFSLAVNIEPDVYKTQTKRDDYLFYDGCVRLVSSGGKYIPLGIGRHNGLLLYGGMENIRPTICKHAFPLGLEPRCDQLDKLCTPDDIITFSAKPLPPTRRTMLWGNQSGFAVHPKIICAGKDVTIAHYLEQRVRFVDHLCTTYAQHRLRLWPVRSYISAPNRPLMTLLELAVCCAPQRSIILDAAHVGQITELALKRKRPLPAMKTNSDGFLTTDRDVLIAFLK